MATNASTSGGDAPYIPASKNLPEITIKAVVLGVLLSIVLAAANTYLGLFAGLTVSASIPAAVISMTVLRAFKQSNILENNIVQTAASAGESLAAGVLFTIPALVLLGTWTHFDYLQITLISGLGGLLGVLFTIPLRRALIVENPLQFPEGVATAEVLKVGEKGGVGIAEILRGSIIGALVKLGSSGIHLWEETAQGARKFGPWLLYFGSTLSPALLGVGYIVGLNIAVLVFAGGALNWMVAIPLAALGWDWPAYQLQPAHEVAAAWNQFFTSDASLVGTPVDALSWSARIWSTQTRYIGVGSMAVGGLWALIRLRKSLLSGVQSGLTAWRDRREHHKSSIPRTEQDAPMNWILIALVASIIPLFALFWYFTKSPAVAIFMALAMLIAGFLFSAVASYMAGLVGSSNNPISGVTIATILTASLLLLGLVKLGWFDMAKGAAAAILIGAVVCSACAIGGDNMQDLKAGRIVGATPYRQQIMQSVGVVSAAFIMAPVLTILQKGYGIAVPNPDLPHPENFLKAPQATLMASVAKGVFALGDKNAEQLPWNMVAIGAGVAVAIIALDLFLESRKIEFRTPVLAVAVGIYLPLELSTPIFVGGLVAWGVDRYFKRRIESGELKKKDKEAAERRGLLASAGLITGEALMGIALAIPIALKIPLNRGMVIGTVILIGVIWILFRSAITAPKKK